MHFHVLFFFKNSFQLLQQPVSDSTFLNMHGFASGHELFT